MTKAVNNFAGLNGFVWWVGAVENRVDPLGLGRCQVRIFGWYGREIPTADLPWAQAVYPINASKTFSAPMLGDWILGFFMDGESGQFPCMLGVLPGIWQDPTSYKFEKSEDPDMTDKEEDQFVDPDKEYGDKDPNDVTATYNTEPTDTPEEPEE
jgi:hypothetical protein